MRRALAIIISAVFLLGWWAFISEPKQAPSRYLPSERSVQAGIQAARMELRLHDENADALLELRALELIEIGLAEDLDQARRIARIDLAEKRSALERTLLDYESRVSPP